MASTATTVVVVGTDGERPTAWYSDDGRSWHRAAVDTQSGVMTGVAAVAEGFLAIGVVGDDVTPTLWRSTDGRSWRSESLAVEGAGDAIRGPVAGPAGRLVMIGLGAVPEAWYSDDGGRNWVSAAAAPAPPAQAAPSVPAVPDPSSPEDADGEVEWTINDIAGSSRGFVAVGAIAGIAAAWRSADGTTWQSAEVDSADVEMAAVTRAGDGFIAVGHASDTVPVWRSDDGGSWSKVRAPGLDGAPSLGLIDETGIVATADRVVIIGAYPTNDPANPIVASVWTNPAPARPAPNVPKPLSHRCPKGTVDLVHVAELTPVERLSCFGHRRLTLTGYVAGWPESGAYAEGKPGWLANEVGFCQVLPVDGLWDSAIHVGLHFRTFESCDPLTGSWIRVTGSFDDPLSSSCRPSPGGLRKAAVVLLCREAFVVKSVKKVRAP